MSSRPIWTGSISFGLLNIPVRLMPAERHTDLRFHLLDSRDRNRVRYERINAETGAEVPWKDVVKAYEYSKGSYVVLEEEDLKEAAPESKESVDIEAFVDAAAISLKHYDRPYFLVPAPKAEKGYVLLRETLKDQKLGGLARVVIRTREYLALVLPEDAALVLYLLRYPQELVDAGEYVFPDKPLKNYRIAPKELEMARQLVKSMVADWQPEQYRDEFRARLNKVISARMKKGGTRARAPAAAPAKEAGSGKVVDFMALLQKSISEQRRTPAAKAARPTKAAKPAQKGGTRPAARRRRAG